MTCAPDPATTGRAPMAGRSWPICRRGPSRRLADRTRAQRADLGPHRDDGRRTAAVPKRGNGRTAGAAGGHRPAGPRRPVLRTEPPRRATRLPAVGAVVRRVARRAAAALALGGVRTGDGGALSRW